MRAILLPALIAFIFLATKDAQAERNETQVERPAISVWQPIGSMVMIAPGVPAVAAILESP